MFLLAMAGCYNTFDLQHMLIPRFMGEKILKYQDGLAFGRIDRHGGHSAEKSQQDMELYPDKYGPELPPGEDPVEANIFANPFSKMSEKYPNDFRARDGSTGLRHISGIR